MNAKMCDRCREVYGEDEGSTLFLKMEETKRRQKSYLLERDGLCPGCTDELVAWFAQFKIEEGGDG